MSYLIYLILLAIGSVSSLAIPAQNSEQNDNTQNFNIDGEWNWIPDENYKLQRVHINDMKNPEPLFFFNAERDIKFILYTRNSNGKGQILKLNNVTSITNSLFNRAIPTRFIVHGWNNNRYSYVNTLLLKEYLKVRNVNVIIVDWGAGAQTINYYSARNRVSSVGRVLATMIDFMVTNSGLNLNSLALVGYSLGAHASGIAGKQVTSGKINSIIGLDPAGPLFYMRWPNDRINKGDANYVEIIHTNGGTLGFMNSIGDADFYPNGGRSQPGCGLDLFGMCAHTRAVKFFGESVNSKIGFWSIPCNFDELRRGRCTRPGMRATMGGDPSNYNTGIEGVYYLETNYGSPFAQIK